MKIEVGHPAPLKWGMKMDYVREYFGEVAKFKRSDVYLEM